MYNKRVLIADDSKESVRLTSFLLAKYKFDIDVANDGVETVQKLLKSKYDLVILDYLMPRLGGIEAMIIADHKISHKTKIRADQNAKVEQSSKPTPVILYTGLENVDLELPFVENFDIVGYWSKGESIPHLIDKLDYMMSHISTDNKLAAA